MEQRLPFHLQLRNEREKRGWTQGKLAEKVGTDFKTVYRWESGKSLPRSYYRQQFVKLFNKSLEELGLLPDDGRGSVGMVGVDWGEAPLEGNFYGRQEELNQISSWIGEGRCRVVALLGIGGIGKTTLATRVALSVKEQFQCVFWRSLQNMPLVYQVIKAAIECLSGQNNVQVPDNQDELALLLLKFMREKRCLIVLDNLEAVLQEGKYAGFFHQEYLGYERLLRLLGESQHQSCLLLTSREKPRVLALLEGVAFPVRSFFLEGIGVTTGQALLQEKALTGTEVQWSRLVALYSGNPLALKLISETVREIFGGNLGAFLKEGEIVFGGVGELIEQQLQRLSSIELEILYWLAIEREPIALEHIYENLVRSFSRGEVLAALESLKRRFLLESRGGNRLTLQPVIMEYIMHVLVKSACLEFGSGESTIWKSYAFVKAQSKDYIRVLQQRMILVPILERLCAMRGKQAVIQALHQMLREYRDVYGVQRSYLAGNVLHALIYLRGDLHGLDVSHLEVRQAYLQSTVLKHVNCTGAHFVNSVFQNAFGNVLAVTFHPAHDILAAGMADGDIWIYQIRSATPLLVCRGHTDAVWSLAFHPDGNILASCSDDQTICLWDMDTGACIRRLLGHKNRVRSIAFSPDGELLVSGGEDQVLRIWQVESAQCLMTFSGHTERIWSVAFHPDGGIVASGSTDKTIRLWDIRQQRCIALLQGHTDWVRSVAFSPDGSSLASGSDDKSIRIWSMETGTCLKVLEGHQMRIWYLTYSAEGNFLASGGEDGVIRIWRGTTGDCLRVLHEHTQGVRALAFNMDGSLFVSGGEDQTLRVWDGVTGDCLRTIQGYTDRIWSLACSGDGSAIVSCSEDKRIRLWRREDGACIWSICVPEHGARDVALSPDRRWLASCGEDQTVRIWDLQTGQCSQVLRGHTTWIRALAWSADGRRIASGGEDTTIRVWEFYSEADRRKCTSSVLLCGHSSWVRSLCFHPAGTFLASGSDDATIRLWNGETGQCEGLLQGHTGRVRAVVWSDDGRFIASASEDGTVRVWDVQTRQCRMLFSGHTRRVHAVAWGPSQHLLASGGDDLTVSVWDVVTGQRIWVGEGHSARIRSLRFSGTMLVSGSDDGTIRLWDMEKKCCVAVLHGEKPYEGMNIRHASGLTDAQRSALFKLGAVEI